MHWPAMSQDQKLNLQALIFMVLFPISKFLNIVKEFVIHALMFLVQELTYSLEIKDKLELYNI